MAKKRKIERHGTFWRNRYGTYFHGRWVPMRQECLGCIFWALLFFVAFMYVVVHVPQWAGH